MVEAKGRQKSDNDTTRAHSIERAVHPSRHAVAVQERPAYSTSLLGNSVLNGRGNAPIKIALMQQAQQTQGNRAVERFLQRSPALAVQRGGDSTTKKASEIEFRRQYHGALILTWKYGGEGKEAFIRQAIEMYLHEYLEPARAWHTEMFDILMQSMAPGAKEPVVGEQYQFRMYHFEVLCSLSKHKDLFTEKRSSGSSTRADNVSMWNMIVGALDVRGAKIDHGACKITGEIGQVGRVDPTKPKGKAEGVSQGGKSDKPSTTKNTKHPDLTKKKPDPKLTTRNKNQSKTGGTKPVAGGKVEKEKGKASTKEKLLKLAETVVDLATDFIPGISNLKDAHTCIRGKNAVTGEEVGGFGRALSCIFAIPGLGNIAKYAGKGLKILGKGLLKGGKYLGKGLAKAWKWGKGKIAAAGKWLSETIVQGGRGLLNKLKSAWNWLKKKLGFGGKKAAKKAGKDAIEKAAKNLAEQVGTEAAEKAAKGAVAAEAKFIEKGAEAAVESEVKRLTEKAAKDAAEKAAKDALEKGLSEQVAKEAAEKAAKEAGEKRANRVLDLSKDPDHASKIGPKSVREAEVGLGLEEAGKIKGPITRDPVRGRGEFIDAEGKVWDVKGFNSNFPATKGGYSLKDATAKVKKELDKGEKVIVDTKNMKPEHVDELREAAKQNGWLDVNSPQVIFSQ